jgi:hypothetical protein
MTNTRLRRIAGSFILASLPTAGSTGWWVLPSLSLAEPRPVGPGYQSPNNPPTHGVYSSQ